MFGPLLHSDRFKVKAFPPSDRFKVKAFLPSVCFKVEVFLCLDRVKVKAFLLSDHFKNKAFLFCNRSYFQSASKLSVKVVSYLKFASKFRCSYVRTVPTFGPLQSWTVPTFGASRLWIFPTFCVETFLLFDRFLSRGRKIMCFFLGKLIDWLKNCTCVCMYVRVCIWYNYEKRNKVGEKGQVGKYVFLIDNYIMYS